MAESTEPEVSCGLGKPRQGALVPREAMPLRGALAALVLLGLAAATPGCAKSQRQHRAVWPRQPAAGRPATCPDDAVDPFGDGTPGPDDARCSYADAQGRLLVQLRGTVLGEGEAGQMAMPLSEVEVTVHAIERARSGDPRDEEVGPTVARGRTDAQGAFSMSAMLRPGTYVVRVGGAEQRIEIDGGDVEPVRVLVPAGI